MPIADNILKEALTLKPTDKEIDALWAKEAEVRMDAYNLGKIKGVSIEKVLEKYR